MVCGMVEMYYTSTMPQTIMVDQDTLDNEPWVYRLWCHDCEVIYPFYSKSRYEETKNINGRYKHDTCGSSMHRFCQECYWNYKEPCTWPYDSKKEEYHKHLLIHVKKAALREASEAHNLPSKKSDRKQDLLNLLEQYCKSDATIRNGDEKEAEEGDGDEDDVEDDPHIEERKVLKKYRLKQSKFRHDVGRRFGWKCAVSDCAVVQALEAAHINGIDSGNSMNNGMLLRGDLHSLYDRYLWSINNDGQVVLSQKLKDYGDANLMMNWDGNHLGERFKNNKFCKTHYNVFESNNQEFIEEKERDLIYQMGRLNV